MSHILCLLIRGDNVLTVSKGFHARGLPYDRIVWLRKPTDKEREEVQECLSMNHDWEHPARQVLLEDLLPELPVNPYERTTAELRDEYEGVRKEIERVEDARFTHEAEGHDRTGGAPAAKREPPE
jgi:hypothetical protein